MGGTASLNHNQQSHHRAFFRLAVLAPFVLSAALHLSVLFLPLAALPMIFARLRYGRFIGVLCALSNLAIVWSLSGRLNAALFFVIGVVLASTLAESLKLKMKLEWAVIFSIGTMTLAASLLLLSYSHRNNLNPVKKFDAFVGSMVNQVAQSVERYKATSSVSNPDLEKFLVDPEMTKKNIIYEFPSAATIMLLILSVGNLLLTLKLNFAGVREQVGLKEDFFKQWRAPEQLVWPTIVAGFFLVYEVRGVTDVALNLFKVLMAVYAIQGLAITTHLFDVWGLKGVLRILGYIVAIAILLPLVISLGFFDLWFSFREKIKSS